MRGRHAIRSLRSSPGGAPAGLRPRRLRGEHGARPGQNRIRGDSRVARERADRDPAAVLAHVAQVVEPVDVDERRRPCNAELQRRNQRVAAGEQLRVLVGAEQLDRLLDRSRPP